MNVATTAPASSLIVQVHVVISPVEPLPSSVTGSPRWGLGKIRALATGGAARIAVRNRIRVAPRHPVREFPGAESSRAPQLIVTT